MKNITENTEFYIPYHTLHITNYEATGNRIGVLNLDSIQGITNLSPYVVRRCLEDNRTFRIWLQQEGITSGVDSIMIYYQAKSRNYDFVSFVGEPNALIESEFSEMCGNGIRALGLHLALHSSDELQKQFLSYGISIHAGEVRNLRIDSINPPNSFAKISVDMGVFQNEYQIMKSFLNDSFRNLNLSQFFLEDKILPVDLQGSGFGLGLNGSQNGEPHLVLVLQLEEYIQLSNYLQCEIDSRNSLMDSLRNVVSILGNKITFNSTLFPKNINFSIAVVVADRLFISTHERNLAPQKYICLSEQSLLGRCRCNTNSCGTAGSVAANLAYVNGFIKSDKIATVHPGGEITYLITEHNTQMIGEARMAKHINSSANKDSNQFSLEIMTD